MASALTIKSGGTWAVKSGATMAIKDAGLPPYVIEGLEQSHWMAENANVIAMGGTLRVDSVPDVYGSNITMSRVYTNDAFQYSSDAWQLNGKTLPAMSPYSASPKYRANGWTSKLNNYAGAWTVISLRELAVTTEGGHSTFFALGDTSQHRGYTRGYDGVFLIKRSSGGAIWARDTTGSAGKQIVVEEYTGTSASTAIGQFRLWINGVEKTPSEYYVNPPTTYGRVPLTGLDCFEIVDELPGANAKWCHTHIYKGSLTDEQRNQVTNYLKSISGIV